MPQTIWEDGKRRVSGIIFNLDLTSLENSQQTCFISAAVPLGGTLTACRFKPLVICSNDFEIRFATW